MRHVGLLDGVWAEAPNMLWLTSVLKRSVSLSESEDMQQAKKQVKQLAVCQDLGPDKLYSTLRSMTHQSSICAFWLWPGGKLSDHQAVGLRSSQKHNFQQKRRL